MTWVDVSPPTIVVGEIEVVHPYTKTKMLHGPTEIANETFTLLRIGRAEAHLSRSQVAGLAGMLTGILDEERRRDIGLLEAHEDRALSESASARKVLLERFR